jgi:hypothetical protein
MTKTEALAALRKALENCLEHAHADESFEREVDEVLADFIRVGGCGHFGHPGRCQCENDD